MKLSPIILFVYNRPWHLAQTVNSLANNFLAKESELFIFSDGPKDKNEMPKIRDVRSYLQTISGFKKIVIKEREKNLGLAKSVILGVSEVIKKYKRVIVLEDDLVSTPNFLKFMNQTLDFYEDDKRIFSVAGYNYPIEIPKNYPYPVYLSYRCTSWGWGTWFDRWQKVDWQVKDFDDFSKSDCARGEFNKGGEDLTTLLDYQMKGFIDSWAIRFCYAHYKNKAYCLHPTVSKIKNIGLEGSGTHRVVRKINIVLDDGRNENRLPEQIEPDKKLLQNFSAYFRIGLKNKLIGQIKELIYKISKSTKLS